MQKPIIAIAWSQYPGGRMGYRSGNPLPDPFFFDLLVDGDSPPTHLPLFARADLMGEALDRYMNFVTLGGGIPVIVPIAKSTDTMGAILDRVDGVLLSGGDDVAPSFFAEKPLSRECTGNLPRTWSETALIREAVARKLPLFGICRGIQQLNVTFGGSLLQDLPTQAPSELNHYDPHGRTFHSVTSEGPRN
ncbi:MAG: gamma-glutamyl-gamma-aminobutyrate hydrolase family protein [bacterium]|nr:gamma-glutamyl-gamma-aminobutyrate hydrolase family protein [bacterium]